jgi:hypothetical protein
MRGARPSRRPPCRIQTTPSGLVGLACPSSRVSSGAALWPPRGTPARSDIPPTWPSELPSHFGADDGIRTRDPHLGKVMLYQLSHVRVRHIP